VIRRAAPVAALAAAALAVAGCGGDEEEPAQNPAEAVPADAVVYFEAQLRPEGEERAAIEAPLAALLNTDDPGGYIVERLDRSFADDEPELSYAEDVEPWLGERGALFLTEIPFEEDEPVGEVEGGDLLGAGVEGAVVLESTDSDATRAAVEKALSAEEDAQAETYEGVDYTRAGTVAVGVVGDALVFGSREGFEAVVDTEAGGESLAEDDGFTEAVGVDAGSAAAAAYVAVPELIDQAGSQRGANSAHRARIAELIGGVAEEPIGALVEAETTGVAVEISHGAGEFPPLTAAGESALLRDLPADTWLALGVPGAGEAIGAFVERAGSGFGRGSGFDLSELSDPLGDGAFFGSGEGIFGTGGGAAFEVEDTAAGERIVEALEAAARRRGMPVTPVGGSGVDAGFSVPIPELPGSLNVAAAGGRVAMAYGEAATAGALQLERGESLGDSEGFTAAVEKLGEEYDVTTYLDFAPLSELAEAASFVDPRAQEAIAYLDGLDFLIAGSTDDGDRVRQRLYLGISGISTEPTA
jgi:hypothetical protein